MAKCEITGKRKRTGNTVSHANNRNKRDFGANIQKVKIVDENGTRRRVYVSTKVLKSGGVQKVAPRKVLLQIMKDEQELAG
ncbi:MAG: large subunit ribosomal protein [Candidatus Sumerlaeota bacterium]|nr:large subunit ribosomal protein [Candidatus Sumerlaeota bacterium]